MAIDTGSNAKKNTSSFKRSGTNALKNMTTPEIIIQFACCDLVCKKNNLRNMMQRQWVLLITLIIGTFWCIFYVPLGTGEKLSDVWYAQYWYAYCIL